MSLVEKSFVDFSRQTAVICKVFGTEEEIFLYAGILAEGRNKLKYVFTNEDS